MSKVIYSLIGATAISIIALNVVGASAAGPSATTRTSITVEPTCSMTATVNTAHTASLVNGTYSSVEYPDGIGKTTIQTFCNDQNGYAIYAAGFTNNELGNTVLKSSTLSSTYDIVTGTATSGDVSNWAMKVSAVSGTYAPTIQNGFNSFSAVPPVYTKVASLDNSTDLPATTNIGSSIETTYAAYISTDQPPASYVGQVKYILVHPSSDIATNYLMQDIDLWKNELLPGIAYTATDSRDGTVYSVAKLADGNVWLLDNLALDLSTAGTLTSSDTNIASNWTAPAEITTWANSYTDPKINTESKDLELTYGSGNGKVGVYYNYCAASAGTYCMDSSSGSGNASQDICPKGWRLPTGDSGGEYQALYTAYSSNATNFKNALRTPLSGTFYDGSAYYQGSDGNFWSSTYYSASNMYHLGVNTTNVNPQYIYYRNNGFSVRCIAKSSIADVTSMQNLAELSPESRAEVLASMTEGEAYRIKDSRDGQTYNIAKLADGKLWFLDNLALDLSTVGTLTPENTNITSNWTAPAEITTWENSYTDPKINAESKDLEFTYGSGNGKVGIYYNYCAATAGTYCMDSSSGSGNASQDICPKGWRLPTGGSSGEYQALYIAYSSNDANFKNALRTPLSGRFYDGSASDQGSNGSFRSSTYVSATSMYGLYVYTANVAPQGSTNRSYGLSVRCVLDDTIDYKISYNKNTTDTVTNIPSTQSGSVSNKNTTINLSSDSPLRTGYSFLGWCDTRTTTSNNTDSCSGTTYGSGQAYPLTPPTTTVTLYAMWEVLPSLAMQNVTASTCTTSPTRVYDTRDRHIYTIQKLADGRCWLLDNLALGATTLTEAISPSNTNIPSGTSFTLPASSSTGFTSADTATAMINTGFANLSFSYGAGNGKVGVYYNYCAATAGTYCYDSSSGTGDATADICPKGWRMPTGSASGEYQALYTAYNSNDTNFKNALRTPLSGIFNNSSAGVQGSRGYFWSSTYYSAMNMYYLIVHATDAGQAHSYRHYGYSVRCILK